MATIPELKTLKRGDYIEVSKDYCFYFKVLDVTKNGFYLSHPFSKGSKPRKGKWFTRFYPEAARYDHSCWNGIRADNPKAKGIESSN